MNNKSSINNQGSKEQENNNGQQKKPTRQKNTTLNYERVENKPNKLTNSNSQHTYPHSTPIKQDTTTCILNIATTNIAMTNIRGLGEDNKREIWFKLWHTYK